MARKSWDLRLEDGSHQVVVDHSQWSGRIEVSVDGRVIERTRKLFQLAATGSDHPFRIGDHSLAVAIRPNLMTYRYDLFLDGRSVETGADEAPLATQQSSWARFALRFLPSVALPIFLGASRRGGDTDPLHAIALAAAIGGGAALLGGLGHAVLDRADARGWSGWRSRVMSTGVVLGAYAIAVTASILATLVVL